MGTAGKICIRWNTATSIGIWPGHLDQYALPCKRRAELTRPKRRPDLGSAAQPRELPGACKPRSSARPANPWGHSHPSPGNQAPRSPAITQISAAFILSALVSVCCFVIIFHLIFRSSRDTGSYLQTLLRLLNAA